VHALHIIQRYYPYLGGSELVCQVLSERLVKEGQRVSVWTTNAWDLDHFWARGRRTVRSPIEQHNGVQIRRFPVERVPGPAIVYPIVRRLMVELSRFPGTTGVLNRMARITPRVPQMVTALQTTPERFDLVHTANITLDFTILPALQFARERKIPHVVTPYVHLGEPGDRSLVRYYTMRHQIDLLKQSDRVIVQTPLEEEYLANLGVPPQIMRTVGVGVDPAEVAGGDADRFRAETGIAAPWVLSVGSLARAKGMFDLIAAMQQLWTRGRREDLVLVGTPMAQFEEFWQTLTPAVQQRIHVFARAPQERKLDALAAATVFAMPSRTDSFGISYLEAWMYGLPVVGARAGGVPAVINDGVTGYLVPFANPTALATTLQRLLENPALAQQLGAAGRSHALRYLTWDRVYAQWRNVYAELVDFA
jgi:glycosyltransferase involved in cell wall biosynthesis